MGKSNEVKTDDLDRFIERIDGVVKKIPETKQKVYQQVGEALLANVRKQIDSRTTDSRGRVKSWQGVEFGDRGGYVKVRPTDKRKDKWGYSGVMKTYAIERGHAIPTPTGRSERYRPRLSDKLVFGTSGRGIDGIVPGRMFYSWAKMDANRIALLIAKECIEELLEHLEE